MEKSNVPIFFFVEIMTNCWKTDPKGRGPRPADYKRHFVNSNYLNLTVSSVKFNEKKDNLFGLATLLTEKSQMTENKLQFNSKMASRKKRGEMKFVLILKEPIEESHR